MSYSGNAGGSKGRLLKPLPLLIFPSGFMQAGWPLIEHISPLCISLVMQSENDIRIGAEDLFHRDRSVTV